MLSFLLKSSFLLLILVAGVFAQTAFVDNIPDKGAQEVADDNVPVLIKHLPDWEKVRKKTQLVSDTAAFSKAVGNDSLAQAVAFTSGTEAVVADYPEGKLAIVEFTTPQMATDNDARIQASLGEGQSVVYRRVGNYAVFVFGAKDQAAANALIDQVKYEKVVQWLGTNPNIAQKKERDTVRTTSEVVLNAIQITGYIILVTLTIGGFAGFLVFRSRNRQRLNADTYTDAGGMTTLNLESSPVSTDKLLN
jgi:hypothetical protein